MTETGQRKQAIAARFGARAAVYDQHAGLQQDIAARLAGLLPSAPAGARVLEVGCGTGFLTRHLLERYRDASFLISDIAPEMVRECERRFPGTARFRVMDGEAPDHEGPFDLIASSMTVQWFADPAGGVRRLAGLLAPGGTLIYSALGADAFPEWRAALAAEALRDGTTPMPPLPGVVAEEHRRIEYGSGRDFLAVMKSIGAAEPRPGYRSLPPGALRRALRRLECGSGVQVTWHIVYGRIDALPG